MNINSALLRKLPYLITLMVLAACTITVRAQNANTSIGELSWTVNSYSNQRCGNTG
jgi:hypothetical protein